MAKRVSFKFEKTKRKNPRGIHAKCKTSRNKRSKNYKKIYNRQGK